MGSSPPEINLREARANTVGRWPSVHVDQLNTNNLPHGTIRRAMAYIVLHLNPLDPSDIKCTGKEHRGPELNGPVCASTNPSAQDLAECSRGRKADGALPQMRLKAVLNANASA
jgi:hypothetical protein